MESHEEDDEVATSEISEATNDELPDGTSQVTMKSEAGVKVEPSAASVISGDFAVPKPKPEQEQQSKRKRKKLYRKKQHTKLKAEEPSIYEFVAGRVQRNQEEPALLRVDRAKRPITAAEHYFKHKHRLFHHGKGDDRVHWHPIPEENELPSSDLLIAIHQYASHYFGNDEKYLRFMDETALLAMGVLLEETMKESLGENGFLALYENTGADSQNGSDKSESSFDDGDDLKGQWNQDYFLSPTPEEPGSSGKSGSDANSNTEKGRSGEKGKKPASGGKPEVFIVDWEGQDSMSLEEGHVNANYEEDDVEGENESFEDDESDHDVMGKDNRSDEDDISENVSAGSSGDREHSEDDEEEYLFRT